jgi:bifunctional non-homologous end joining protein LigD
VNLQDGNVTAEMPNFLDDYRRKRSPDRTPEPMGRGESRPGIFVVQKHAATRLHYDLRLEWDGALKSWAVPKGPSPDPAEKRLAMQTEDHPVEYADFEGVIPAGNYGAGRMIVWDCGRCVHLIDPRQGMADGKLLFELSGYKLRGRWTLVRTKRNPREWLLIKETGDAHVRRKGTFPEQSVLSGLGVDEVGADRSAIIAAELQSLAAPRGRVQAADVEVMLAEPRAEPFDDPDWLFELKVDGFRAVTSKDGTRAAIHYRRGSNATAVFPELANALRSLPYEHVVFDGEIAVLDEQARPVFQRLQRRALLTDRLDIARAAAELPASLFIFDLLGFGDFDLRILPLLQRKEVLRKLLPPLGPLRYIDHVEGQGRALYASIRELGLEGIVGKRKLSSYRGGRFRDWVKVRIDHTGDFVVVGYTRGEGSRSGFGALHVAQQQPEGLVYAGRVGGGFSEEELARAQALLEKLQIPAPPCSGPVPKGRGHTWCKPSLVVEVRYKEITEDGLLRQPTFLRIRDDKGVEECEPQEPPPVARGAALSNLDKVFWPEAGFTKGDLIEYYRAISPWLLPYLRDRAVTLTRYPDGIVGKSFFQKDAPDYVPGWVRTARVGEIDYFVCDDLESLFYVVNLGTIPLHLPANRLDRNPDWCVIDLDPKEAPFAWVVTLAKAVHVLCEELGLPSFPKTSGQKGLHVLIPLGAQLNHQQATSLGELIARVIESRHPDLGTTERNLSARGGRVYLDFLQNGDGKTIAGPFSARPVPGATVSAPLRWSEVNGRLDPKKFTLKSMPARMKRLRADPLSPVLELSPDLPSALSRLGEQLRIKR